MADASTLTERGPVPTDPKARTDRTVHATLRGRIELVRYDRSGRWFVESVPTPRRTGISARHAAAVADVIEEDGGRVYYRAGGDRMLAARSQVGIAERIYARSDLLAGYGVAKSSPADRINLVAAQNMSPQTLRDFVTSNGGTIVCESDYRYTPDQGGDGEDGKLSIDFADRSGVTVGRIGFSRWKPREDGAEPHFNAVDFEDLRDQDDRTLPRRAGWIHKSPRAFVSMLAAVLDQD